jgi:glycosyltransferase involved in cell wall biosynthesis
MKNRRKRIFINANFSKNSVQAQDRDGKYYALFLNSKKYEVYGYSTDKEVEDFIKEKENIHYFISSNKFSIILKTISSIIFNRVDIVMSSKAFWKEYLYFRFNKIFNRGKNILVLVNQTPYLWFKFDLKMFSKVVKSTDKVIAISKKVASTFEKKYDIKTTIIPLFYKMNSKEKEEIQNKKKKIVCVGSMISHKRPFVFADLAKSLPEFDFIWVGKGYYYDWLTEKKEVEKIENLELIPRLLQKELFDFLGKCDLFYFPSIHEGFPNVLIEAMNCGLPVVCYNSYGPDAIINDYNGLVLDNIFDSSKDIRAILKDEQKLKELKNNAKKSVEKYNGEKLSIKLEELIDTV